MDFASSGLQQQKDILAAQEADSKIVDLSKRYARRARRMREMNELWGTYSRPGIWDEDFDKYQEVEYIENVGDYQISIFRQGLYCWNGYVILPSSHPIIRLGLNYLELPWNGIVELTRGGQKPDTNMRKFGFDNMHYLWAKREGLPFNYVSFEKTRSTCLELLEWFKYFVDDKIVGTGVNRCQLLFEHGIDFPEIYSLIQEFSVNVIGVQTVNARVLAKKFLKMLSPSELTVWNDTSCLDLTKSSDDYTSKQLIWGLFKQNLNNIKNRGYIFTD